MPSNEGWKQEQHLFEYLRVHQHCAELVEGDQQVRSFLGMKGTPKCADAIGLHQPLNAAGSRRITVAESKGTDMDSAVEQLGNAAAGIFQKFGRETKVELLVMVPSLVERPSGFLSPGHGYRADPLKTGRNKFTLQESMGGPLLPAKPRITYHEWIGWSSHVANLRIVVLTLKLPAV